MLKSKLLPHQQKTVGFFLEKKCILDASTMGCISGDTLVVLNRSGASKTMPISQAYKKMNSWNLSSPIKTRSNVGGRIGLHPIQAIVYSGNKFTYTLTLECGRSLRLTEEHKVLTDVGYVECRHLTPYHNVMVDSNKTPKKSGSKPKINYRYLLVHNHPFSCKRGNRLKKDPRPIGLVPEHRLVAEARLNFMSLDRFREALKISSSGFVFLSKDMAVHHIDMDHTNNAEENLLVCTHKEHNALHLEYSLRNLNQGIESYSKVVSVTPYGYEDTYDIVCEDPHRNFSANDIIIHNSGKSLSVIAAIDVIKKPAVIVCPPFLVENFLNEVRKHSDLKASPHFLKWDSSADITVVPYTQLSKAEDVFKNCKVWACDEVHYLKNLEAKRTQVFHSMFYKYTPEYFMAMSGTPLRNRIVEIYPMLLLWAHWGVKPAITDKYKSFYTFACRFTNVVQGKYGMSYGGMKNVEELRTYIKGHSIKHEANVLDLPELTESEVVVSYNDNPDLEKAFREFNGSTFSAEITVKVSSAASKAVFTANYVSEAVDSGEGPVVVFSDHRKPIEIMELELSKLRVRSITGETPMSARSNFVDMFNNGQLDVLLITYGAGSTGINLTASNLMVLSDLPWTVAELEQAKKRSHRLGQKKACRIVHVIGSKVDTLIKKTLEAKLKVISEVMR